MKRLIRRLTVVAALSAAGLTVVNSAGAGVASIGPSIHFGIAEAVFYTAEPGEPNKMTITQSSTDFEIEDLGTTVTVGAGCALVDAHHATCPFSQLSSGLFLEVDLGDADDFLKLDELSCDQAALSGGDGADTILGGDCFLEEFFGGPGDDHLRGRGEVDVIDGGLGADTMSGGTSGFSHANVFHRHEDTLTYEDRVNGVSVEADNLPNDGEPREGDNVRPDFERVKGGSGNDRLVAFPQGGSLFGEAGNDILKGGTRFDILTGGLGNDVLRGGPSRDWLFGNQGDDDLWGGRGPDQVNAGWGNDYLVGGLGQDRLSGRAGNDVFRAREGHRDFLRGGGGTDRARIDALLDDVSGVEKLLP